MGVLVSAEQLKDTHQTVIYIPSGGTRSPLTLLFKPFLSAFSTSLIIRVCSLKLQEGLGMESFFLQTRTGDTEGLAPRRALQGPAQFQCQDSGYPCCSLGSNWKGTQEPSGLLAIFCFLIWVLVTQVCSLCKNYKLYIWDFCTFLYVYYT